MCERERDRDRDKERKKGQERKERERGGEKERGSERGKVRERETSQCNLVSKEQKIYLPGKLDACSKNNPAKQIFPL